MSPIPSPHHCSGLRNEDIPPMMVTTTTQKQTNFGKTLKTLPLSDTFDSCEIGHETDPNSLSSSCNDVDMSEQDTCVQELIASNEIGEIDEFDCKSYVADCSQTVAEYHTFHAIACIVAHPPVQSDDIIMTSKMALNASKQGSHVSEVQSTNMHGKSSKENSGLSSALEAWEFPEATQIYSPVHSYSDLLHADLLSECAYILSAVIGAYVL